MAHCYVEQQRLLTELLETLRGPGRKSRFEAGSPLGTASAPPGDGGVTVPVPITLTARPWLTECKGRKRDLELLDFHVTMWTERTRSYRGPRNDAGSGALIHLQLKVCV